MRPQNDSKHVSPFVGLLHLECDAGDLLADLAHQLHHVLAGQGGGLEEMRDG